MKKTKTIKKNEQELDFDPVLCVKQYEQLLELGKMVSYTLATTLNDPAYRFTAIKLLPTKKASLALCYTYSWWDVPAKIISQGVDATANYIVDVYNAKLEKHKKELEKIKKEREEEERRRDLETYNYLKEKLGIR